VELKNVVQAFARHLVDQGDDVLVICANDPRCSPEMDEGVRIKRLPWLFKIATTKITLGLPLVLLHEKWDVVKIHIPTPWSADWSVLSPATPIGGWVVAGAAGRSSHSGPTENWASVSGGRKGYVVSGDYFEREIGTCQTKIVLSSTGRDLVEACGTTGNILLSRFAVSATNGRTLVTFPVTVSHLYPHSEVYRGWGPFSFTPPFIPPGNALELRVWQPGSSQVRVFSLSLSCSGPQSCPST
jgi:hypothetical protein